MTKRSRGGRRSSEIKKYLIMPVIVCVFALILTIFALNLKPFSVSALTSAQSMAVLEVSTGRVLYSKNMHKQMRPASTTKILTAIVVIENVDDLDKLVKIPPKAVGVEGSSIYLQAGEELSVRDLLYGLMLQSGNDCAEALAILVSGSLGEFANLMNCTANRIGAVNSHFVTPHGLDAEGHLTTAYDLALISAYALRNDDFAGISKTKKHTCPYMGRNYDRVILNKNKLLNSLDGCDGVKTGYTKKAGRTFVGSATRDNMQVVCAVLNCGPMFEDTASLINKAFKEFKMTAVFDKGVSITQAAISDGKTDKVNLGVNNAVLLPLTENEIGNLTFEYELPNNITAPLKQGEQIGSVKILNQNELLLQTNLYTLEAVDSLDMSDRLKDIVDNWNSAED